MNGRWLHFLIFALLFLAACRVGTAGEFSSNQADTIFPPRPGQPVILELTDLASQPASYAGDFVQVTGQYRRGPVLVCEEVLRPTPATWALSSGDEQIPVAGFDQLIRPIWPRGLMVTVAGIWRQWTGPLGCGKGAPLKTIWYLDATDIVAPDPVARVTLTPPGIAGVTVAPLATSAPGSEEEATLPATVAAAEQTPTATASVTPSHTPTATVTPSISPTVGSEGGTPSPTTTQPPDGNGEGTPITPAPSATGVNETPVAGTPSPTPGEGTAIAPTATASPTVTVSAGSILSQGGIGYEDLRGRLLPAGLVHSWQLEVTSGRPITVAVAASLQANIAVEILTPNGDTILQQDNRPAGEVEVVEAFIPQRSGPYQLLISASNGAESNYLMMVTDEDAYNFVFAGILSIGQGESTSQAADTDQFWFFSGQEGEVVTITVDPSDNSNVLFEVYDPAGNKVVDFADTDLGFGGDTEQLSYEVEETGLYAIRVGESAFATTNYTITVSR